ncbi:protein NLRC3-like [Dermacentor albipictus]|uniref:protein NLRC3-like n=1 Tax=Dermacentor albipictus TaxID=60249 RepID=UPI0038FC27F6
MDEGVRKEADAHDTDVNELFRKGLEQLRLEQLRHYQDPQLRHDQDPKNPAGASSESAQQGELTYTKVLSDEDAGVLRRMLSTGPPVKKICIWQMTLNAFRIAFDDFRGCSSLEALQVLRIECGREDCSIKLSGLFSSLRSLDLRCENIGTEFAKELASYLRENKTLTEFSLWYSCGGDEGAAALVETLSVNETLKRFTLAQMSLPSTIFIRFAEVLASNSTLEVVELFDVRFAEQDQVQRLLDTGLCASALKRLRLQWPDQLLPLLTRLLREQACHPELSLSVTSSVDDVVLREFFDAVAEDTTLRALHFYPGEKTFDALARGIDSVVRRTTTLREICNFMGVEPGKERQLVSILDSLKENRSIGTFAMYAESVTAEMAKSLSELLAVNNTLNTVTVCEYWEISPDHVETILQGLRNNYTVTGLLVFFDLDDPDDPDAITEVEELLKRNVRLQKKAAEFVISGSGDVSDVEGADALKKLHSSAGLVEKVQELTGKTREAALEEIQSALARLSP